MAGHNNKTNYENKSNATGRARLGKRGLVDKTGSKGKGKKAIEKIPLIEGRVKKDVRVMGTPLK